MTQGPSRDRGPLAVAWLALILLVLLAAAGRDALAPIAWMAAHVKAACWAIVLLVGAVGQGAAIKKALRPTAGGDFAPFVCAIGIGLGAMSIETLALGAVGLLRPEALTVLALAVPCATYPFWRTALMDAASEARRIAFGSSGPCALPIAFAGASALLALPFALIPTRDFDAMVYHLEVPIRYLQAGRVLPLAENVPSNYPLLTEMLFTLGFALEGYDLAALISFLFFPLTLAAVWAWSFRRFGAQAASWGAALIALTPFCLVDASRVGSDWSATFFTLCAVFTLWSGLPAATGSAVAGALAGMAAGCKYTSLGFAVVLPAVALAATCPRHRLRANLRSMLVFLLSAFAFSSPWYLKNLLFTGDPFFPLLKGGASGTVDVGALAADAHHFRLALADLWRWALSPEVATLDPERFQLSASVGLLPLGLVPLLWLLKDDRPPDRESGRFLLWWAALSFAVWYLTFRVGRFALPIYSLGSAWLGAGLARFLALRTRLGAWMTSAVVLALTVNVGVFLGVHAAANDDVAVAMGVEAPSAYLMRTLEAYPSIAFLNSLDPPPRRVLFLGETRGFYSTFPREVPTFDATHRLAQLLRARSRPDQVEAELRRAGFSHLLVNFGELARLGRISGQLRMDEGELRSLSALLARWRRVHSAKDVAVWEIPDG